MDNFFDTISSGVADILMTFFMVGLLLTGGFLVVLAWMLIKSGMEQAEHNQLLQEAQGIFDRVRNENLPGLQIDPLLRAVFGQEIELQPVGSGDGGDWLSKALYGIE